MSGAYIMTFNDLRTNNGKFAKTAIAAAMVMGAVVSSLLLPQVTTVPHVFTALLKTPVLHRSRRS